jgi:hypothetical protein
MKEEMEVNILHAFNAGLVDFDEQCIEIMEYIETLELAVKTIESQTVSVYMDGNHDMIHYMHHSKYRSHRKNDECPICKAQILMLEK